VNPQWKVELISLGALAPPILRQLRRDLAFCLRHPVWIAPTPIDISPAFDPGRRQYNAISTLQLLLAGSPGPDTFRLGITSADLFLPVFTHVFGTAQLGGTVATASLFRLRPEFSGDPADPVLLRRRVLIESIHELGHLLGLLHCPVSWCAMAPSRLPEHIDLKDPILCPECVHTSGLKLR